MIALPPLLGHATTESGAKGTGQLLEVRWPAFASRILVVDESPADCRRLGGLLAGSRARLSVAARPAELDRQLRSRLGLVVTEHRLSWGDSISVIEKVHARMPELPVIVVTDSGDERIAVRALRAGAADYLRKSATDDRIRNAVIAQLSPWSGSTPSDPVSVPAILSAFGLGFARVTSDSALLDANEALARIAGRANLATLAKEGELRLSGSREARAARLVKLQRNGVLRSEPCSVPRPDGKMAFAEIDVRVVRRASGRTVALEALVRDRSEYEHRRRELAFKAAALDRLPNGVIAVDKHVHVCYWNRTASELFGRSREKALHRPIWSLVVPPENLGFYEAVCAAVERHGAHSFESEDLREDGSRVTLHKSVTIVRDADGRRIGTVLIAADLHDLRVQELQLQQALDDRCALLREANHRVKNSLQVITSLLNLHARHATNPAMRQLVRECQQRVQTIAVAHELTHLSHEPERLDLKAYLQQLLERLPLSGVEVALAGLDDLAPRALDIDLMIALGLIVTELVLASARRAHGDGSNLRIVVALDALSRHECSLSVSDTSTALPVLPSLVQALAEQVRCTLSLESGEAGTRVRLKLPIP